MKLGAALFSQKEKPGCGDRATAAGERWVATDRFPAGAFSAAGVGPRRISKD